MKKLLVFVMMMATMLYCANLALAAPNAEKSTDKWLIYWYISGNNLENTRGKPDADPAATADLEEMTRITFPEVQDNNDNVSINNESNDEMQLSLEEDLEAGNNQRDKLFPTYIDSSVKLSPNVKVLIQTGGCIQWQTKDIPNNTIGRYLFDSDGFHYQGSFPDANMGNADTLEDFLRYGKETVEKEFKPDHRMFIFWGHGGLVSVCPDERYSDSSPLKLEEGDALDLNDIHRAFSKVYKASPNNPPFEIIGFDSCLRATYENANNIYGFARYMIASEELESGYGWYYSDWIKELSDNPSISSKQLSKIICESSFNYLQTSDNISDDDKLNATFSTINLSPSKWIPLRNAYDSFMKNYLKSTAKNDDMYNILNFAAFSGKRYYVGVNSSKGLMVDLQRFAELTKERLSNFDITPSTKKRLTNSADELINAIDSVVIINDKHKNNIYNNGISIHYPLNKKTTELKLYTSQNTISKHTKRLYNDLLFNVQNGSESDNLNADNVQETSSRSTKKRRGTRSSTQGAQEVFDISELYNLPVNLDEDNNEISINLTREQMQKISYITDTLVYLDTGDIDIYRDDDINEDELLSKFNALVLGEDGNIQGDWNTGQFTVTLKPTWTTLNEHLVYTEVLESTKNIVDEEGKVIQKGYVIYGIPMAINDTDCLLKVAYYPDDQKYQILGAKRSTGNTGIPSRESIIPKKGDTITPLFKVITAAENIDKDAKPLITAHTELGDFVYIWIKGESFKLEDDAVVQRKALRNGNYGRIFYFWSLGRNKCVQSQNIVFEIKNGEIEYSEVFDHDEAANKVEYFDIEGEKHIYNPSTGDVTQVS